MLKSRGVTKEHDLTKQLRRAIINAQHAALESDRHSALIGDCEIKDERLRHTERIAAIRLEESIKEINEALNGGGLQVALRAALAKAAP